MRVLMIVQELNPQSWLRGFIVGWVRALAAQPSVEKVYVLALEAYPADLPPNVEVLSMGKELGRNKPRELARFYSHLVRKIGHVDLIFSHMTPRYTWLAAPLAMLYRKPQMLWFVHPHASAETRLALACARWITTATPQSFPIPSAKVHPLGHGIDAELFKPDPVQTLAQTLDNPPLILTVGRMTPIKRHDLLLEAAAQLRANDPDLNARFMVIGGAAAAGDAAYQAELIQQRAALGLSEDDFSFAGALGLNDLIPMMGRATLITNLTPSGSFDKAALEAMLMAKPLLTPNAAFDDLLAEHQPLLRLSDQTNAGEIAAKIAGILRLSASERGAMGVDLRARTAAEHSLNALMGRLVGLIPNVARGDNL